MSVCVHVCVPTCHGAHVEDIGEHSGIDFLLSPPLHGFWESSPGH